MSAPAAASVVLTGVTKWYGNVVAVNDITMSLGAGVTGLLGPNGAGKTTLLHLVAGFLPPSRGSVLVNGVPAWRNPSSTSAAERVPFNSGQSSVPS